MVESKDRGTCRVFVRVAASSFNVTNLSSHCESYQAHGKENVDETLLS